jgi:hypothetical protein
LTQFSEHSQNYIQMKDHLQPLFHFLKANRKYNIDLQKKYREINLLRFETKTEKAFSLLHDTFYTQSQPDLDDAQKFFEDLYNNQDSLVSFVAFCNYLGHYDSKSPYLSLYNGLCRKKGWGQKTSALFTKNIYNIHHLPEMNELGFWTDAPPLLQEDRLLLPVDAVIKDIFMRFNPKMNSFTRINKFLEKEKFIEMDIWDDLWFWGYITQNPKEGIDELRGIGFNKGKYWLQLYTPKDPLVIKEIEEKCKEFIRLLPAN